MVEQNLYVSSWFQDCHHQKGGDCGSNDFQDYFDDAKESRVKQVPKNQESKSFKNQVSKNQDSRTIKFQKSRFKNNQDQDSRLKIQESREDSTKIKTKKVFERLWWFLIIVFV